MNSSLKNQQAPEWCEKPLNVKTESALVLMDDAKMVFTGFLANLLVKDQKRKPKPPPRDVDFWIYAVGDTLEGKGRVIVGKNEFIFPFSQDFQSFLIVAKLIKNPDLAIPPIGKITLYVSYIPKPYPRPDEDEVFSIGEE